MEKLLPSCPKKKQKNTMCFLILNCVFFFFWDCGMYHALECMILFMIRSNNAWEEGFWIVRKKSHWKIQQLGFLCIAFGQNSNYKHQKPIVMVSSWVSTTTILYGVLFYFWIQLVCVTTTLHFISSSRVGYSTLWTWVLHVDTFI